MRYLLALYGDESAWETATPDQITEVMGAYDAFGQEAGDIIVAGDGLEPSNAATSVRVRDGETMLTDGPFAETKEQLGGFYVIDVPNLDEALKWAAKLPAALDGTVEVRPVMDYEAYGSADPSAARQEAQA